MSRGQIDIDVNIYLNSYTEHRTWGSHLYRYREEKAKKNIILFLFLFSKDPKTMEKSTCVHSGVKISSNFPV